MQLSRAPLLLSYLAIGNCEPHEGVQQACPSPWVDGTILDLGCLLFNSTMGYTWEGASVYCQGEENATLVEIWTETQLHFIQMELRLLGEVESSKVWWIAGTDVGREGKWNWASSTASVGEFIWAASNPNGGMRDNCLALSDIRNYKGSDTRCSNSFFPICQKWTNQSTIMIAKQSDQ